MSIHCPCRALISPMSLQYSSWMPSGHRHDYDGYLPKSASSTCQDLKLLILDLLYYQYCDHAQYSWRFNYLVRVSDFSSVSANWADVWIGEQKTSSSVYPLIIASGWAFEVPQSMKLFYCLWSRQSTHYHSFYVALRRLSQFYVQLRISLRTSHPWAAQLRLLAAISIQVLNWERWRLVRYCLLLHWLQSGFWLPSLFSSE